MNDLTILLLSLITFTYAREFVFEFGTEAGVHIYNEVGSIPPFQYKKEIVIPVPEDMSITYIKITLYSISTPEVKYDPYYKKITILFTWFQITKSSYNISAIGYWNNEQKGTNDTGEVTEDL